MKLFVPFFLLFFSLTASSQTLKGSVKDSKGEVLVGTNVHWLGTTIGTSADVNGAFKIPMEGIIDKHLIISYVGYISDTLLIKAETTVNIVLKETETLSEVEIKGQRAGTFISSIDPIKTEIITEEELTKAACCDLAGCFSTQGTVQPTTTNIVTNAKELRILGLSGVYNQVLIEGMPLVQGLTYTYGISTISGTLVDNIYISKGANSVLQGYESIAGQINVELKEPDEAETLLFNAYANSFFEKQLNFSFTKKWKKWSTLLALHSTQPAKRFDKDADTFLDLPLLTRYSVYNKWKYGNQDELGWHSRIGLRYVDEGRIGGQMEFDPVTDKGTTNHYGQIVQFTQPEFYTKTGFRMSGQHHFVLMASAFQQDQRSYFGTVLYEAEQVNAYANLQYEFTWNESHSLKTGVSYRHLELMENIAFGTDTLNRTYAGQFVKNEDIGGFFAENTFDWKDGTLVLITGIRVDQHNDFGPIVTPRTLLKYNFTEATTVRISVGTGWRTVNLFSENINLLASSRDVIITEELKPEQAVNQGVNITHKIFGDIIETQISVDFYRTQFLNQIFPDYDTDPTKAYITNFTGTSISNSFQAEIGLSFFERIETKMAYNYLDVYRIIDGTKFNLPFNATDRITTTFSYKPKNEKWHFDMNLHWYGEQNLAVTAKNPPEFQLPVKSQSYTVVNIQFTKSWKRLELYTGCENIFDFRQKQPILSWQDPFGPYFDTSTVWGPTRGREIYLGLRFKFE